MAKSEKGVPPAIPQTAKRNINDGRRLDEEMDFGAAPRGSARQTWPRKVCTGL